jgi:hypothetical protein
VAQSAADLTPTEKIKDRVAELEATIFRCWTRRCEAVLELGRAFRELKKLLGHGKWKKHFKEAFAPQGISLRTAERYMHEAKRADAETKSDKLALLNRATDSTAQQVHSATEQAKAKVDAELNQSKSEKDIRIYRLPLHITVEDGKAVDALRNSEEWSRAEKQIVRLLLRLCAKYAIADQSDRRRL